MVFSNRSDMNRFYRFYRCYGFYGFYGFYRFAALILLGLTAVGFVQTAVDGVWQVTLTTPQGPTTVDLTLTQDGDKVSGKLNTPLGILLLKGTMVGSDLKSAATIELQGMKLDVGVGAHVDG